MAQDIKLVVHRFSVSYKEAFEYIFSIQHTMGLSHAVVFTNIVIPYPLNKSNNLK